MAESIAGIGLQGLRKAQESAVGNAEKLSKAFNPENPEESTDAVTPIVGLMQDEHQAKAAAKIIKVSEQLDKTVLDILA